MSNVFYSLLIMLLIMAIVVAYQSRKKREAPQVYLSRLFRLIIRVLTYFRNIGVYAAIKFRETNWDVSIEEDVETSATAKAKAAMEKTL